MGHFYYRDGTPAYTVPYANGKPGKATTVPDARKIGLVPSSTGIVGVAKYAGPPSSWMIWNHLNVAYDHIGLGLERNQWIAATKSKCAETLEEQGDLGTKIHDVCERITREEPVTADELALLPDGFDGFHEWWFDSGMTWVETEFPFAHPMGYGGRIDLIADDKDGRTIVLDYKTQDTKGKPVSRLVYRDSHPIQLVSYLEGYKYMISLDMMFVHKPILRTVIVSRDEPGRIEQYDWPEDEMPEYWNEFKRRLGCWVFHNKYDPSWR